MKTSVLGVLGRSARLLLLSGGCILGLQTVASAQSPDVLRPLDAKRWAITFGTDPFDFDLMTRDPGVHGQLLGSLSYTVPLRESGVGLRTQLLLGKALPRGTNFGDASCVTDCRIKAIREYLSFNTTLTRGWRSDARIRPYVLAGPGLYMERTGSEYWDNAAGRTPANVFPFVGTQTRWSLGATAGAGVSFRLMNSDLFIEQGLHMPQLFGNRSALKYSPLVVGVRF